MKQIITVLFFIMYPIFGQQIAGLKVIAKFVIEMKYLWMCNI
jgi:hypothetical protein